MHNLHIKRLHRLLFLLITMTKNSLYVRRIFDSFSSNKEQSGNWIQTRDGSRKLYQLHVNKYILYPPYGNQFSQANIYPDTFYYLGDRKVPDHSNDARTRPVYVAIEVKSNPIVAIAVLVVVVLVKGIGEKKERESPFYRTARITLVSTTVQAEATLMKQMYTRYMQLSRTKICVPFIWNENKFACQTSMFCPAIPSINRIHYVNWQELLLQYIRMFFKISLTLMF